MDSVQLRTMALVTLPAYDFTDLRSSHGVAVADLGAAILAELILCAHNAAASGLAELTSTRKLLSFACTLVGVGTVRTHADVAELIACCCKMIV